MEKLSRNRGMCLSALTAWNVATTWSVNRFFVNVTVVICTLLAGCGGRSDLGQVVGKVTMDGKPLADARVEFYPTQEGSIASGKTDASGEYSMMFSRDVAGASLGENLVRISTHDVGYAEGKGEFAIPERVPAKYNRNSQLTVKVEPGRQRHDFDLKSDEGKVIQPPTPAGL